MAEKKLKRFEIFLLGVICLAIVVVFFMHPRPNYCLMALFCVIHILFLTQKKKSISRHAQPKPYSFIKDFLSTIIVLFFMWVLGAPFVVLYPYHAPYEYTKDISDLRAKDASGYAHFPNEIPEGAQGIKWVNFPTIMQGKGFEGLFFYTSEEYIDSIYKQYRPISKIYRPINNTASYASSYTYFEITFPMENYIPEGTEDGVTVLILYDNNDWNHPSMYGLYFNRQEKYICFFNM